MTPIQLYRLICASNRDVARRFRMVMADSFVGMTTLLCSGTTMFRFLSSCSDLAVPWPSQGDAGFQPERRAAPLSVDRQECLSHHDRTDERKPL